MSERYLSRAKFWKPAPEPYPNVCACIGTEIGVFHDRYWWHAAGPARQQFSLVEPEIVEQLNSVFAERYSSILLFHLYMIGRSKERAVPTIMFFCAEKEPRKMAKKTVDEGGLLAKLPAFRTGHLARRPGVGNLIQPASRDDATNPPVGSDSISEVYFDHSLPMRTIGMPIFVKQTGDVLRAATANAVLRGSEWMLMSVAHVFLADKMNPQDLSVGDDEDEYDLGSGTEVEENETFDATSRASVSQSDETSCDERESTSHGSDSSSDVYEVLNTPEISNLQPSSYAKTFDWILSTEYDGETGDIPALSLGRPGKTLERLGYLSQLSSDGDWSLIKVENPGLEAMLLKCTIRSESRRGSTRQLKRTDNPSIIAHTPHGLIPGSLSNVRLQMRLPNSTTFREVIELSLEHPLQWGDCGSLVSDTTLEEPYGHVVASSGTMTVVYIMPACYVSTEAGIQWTMSLAFGSHVSVNESELVVRHGSVSEHYQEYQADLLVAQPCDKLKAGLHNDVGQSSTNDQRTFTCLVPLIPGRTPRSYAHRELRQIGNSVDPFRSMFQSARTGVSVERLKNYCSQYFGTKALGRYWITKVVETPQIFLSMLCIASAHEDVVLGRTTASIGTTALFQEVIQSARAGPIDDTRIMTVGQLLAAAIQIGDEATTVYYEAGLNAMISHLGDLNNLPLKGKLSSFAPIVVLISAILREAEPLSASSDYCRKHTDMTNSSWAIIPESPLFLPYGDYIRIGKSTQCIIETLEILGDIRYMIDVFLSHDSMSTVVLQSIHEYWLKIGMQTSIDILNIYNTLKPHHWKYEAVRITAIIVATAIMERSRLSEVLSREAMFTAGWQPSSISPLGKYVASSLDENTCQPAASEDSSSVISSSSYAISNPSSATTISTMSWFLSQIELSPLHLPLKEDMRAFGLYSALQSLWQCEGPPGTESLLSVTDPSLGSSNPRFAIGRPIDTAKNSPHVSGSLLKSLKVALENSDLSDCWGDMAGVLLWIGLTAGAASRSINDIALKRYFSATAVRSAYRLSFEHPEAIHATLLRMADLHEKLGRKK